MLQHRISELVLQILCVFFINQTLFIHAQQKLPTIVIQVGQHKIKKKHVTIGKLQLLEPMQDSSPIWHNIEIKRRGSSSDFFAKKQYLVKFYDESFERKKVSVYGLPKDSHWVINGPYVDRSLIRNALAYSIGSNLSASRDQYFAPRTRFVEVYINNNYQGIYVLIEKIRRTPHKVNIHKIQKSYTKGVHYIGEVSASDEDFKTKYGTSIKYVYPSRDKIKELTETNTDLGKFVDSSIKEDLDRFERVLDSHHKLAKVIRDPQQNYFDVDSFVDFIIIQEIFKNVDGFRRSVYFYKSNTGKIHMGPIWDFNLAMGNLNFYGMQETLGWIHKKTYRFLKPAFWFTSLLRDQRFKGIFVRRYVNLRRSGNILSSESLFANIDALADELKPAIKRNQRRWHDTESSFQYYYMNTSPKGRSHKEHIKILKNWLLQRLRWMDQHIKEV